MWDGWVRCAKWSHLCSRGPFACRLQGLVFTAPHLYGVSIYTKKNPRFQRPRPHHRTYQGCAWNQLSRQIPSRNGLVLQLGSALKSIFESVTHLWLLFLVHQHKSNRVEGNFRYATLNFDSFTSHPYHTSLIPRPL
ncbi:hypothetical protein MRB53_008957 [Persea americana]|uniref:Uncharacterized protein n=1 Tax=Persea americana TaxID=3435 RepID=A0ACC2LMU2_PERAE|nr:hypothetical protein MRB53_008957 [Persea americana]